MVLEMVLFYTGIEPRNREVSHLLQEIGLKWGIKTEEMSVKEISNMWDGSQPEPRPMSDFEKWLDLSKQTKGRLTNEQMQVMGEKKGIRIPQTCFGRLNMFLVIYVDNEPLILYPQERNSQKVSIKCFLENLERAEFKSIASEVTPTVLRAEFEKYTN